MFRPIFYFSLVFIAAIFFAVECLGNYFDYLGDSPIFLSPKMLKLFEINRLKLLVVELLIPAGFTLAFSVLAVMKLRSTTIRSSAILVQFLATSFWLSRSFFFPDRMVRYYQMSDPVRYADYNHGEFFFAYFIVSAILLLLLFLIREYSREKDALNYR